jgi:hypothetical protein
MVTPHLNPYLDTKTRECYDIFVTCEHRFDIVKLTLSPFAMQRTTQAPRDEGRTMRGPRATRAARLGASTRAVVTRAIVEVSHAAIIVPYDNIFFFT